MRHDERARLLRRRRARSTGRASSPGRHAARRGRSHRPERRAGRSSSSPAGPDRAPRTCSTSADPTTPTSSASCSPATRSSRTTTAAPAHPGCSTAPACRRRRRPTGEDALAADVRRVARRAARRSTAPPTTPRISTPSARRSASTRSRSSASRTGRSSRSPTRSAHPDHVERLVLDSVLPPSLPDPFSANVAQAMPATLAAFCNGVLRRGDARLRRRRRRGCEPPRAEAASRARCSSRTARRRASASTASASCRSSSTPTSTPRSPPSCRRRCTPRALGNTKPLLRLYDLDTKASVDDRDRPQRRALRRHRLPRRPVPVAVRLVAVQSGPACSRRRSPRCRPGSFGPFGSYAAKLGNADLCVDWPTPAGGTPRSQSAPYPDVPMLALSGGFDMRTPTAGAAVGRRAVPAGPPARRPRRRPQRRSPPTRPAAPIHAVRNWILDATPFRPRRARGRSSSSRRSPPYPPATTPRHLGPAATYAIASKTLREAEASWLLVDGAPPFALRRRALRAGSSSRRQLRVQARLVRIAPGVTISGPVRISRTATCRSRSTARSPCSGASASAGVLGLVKSSLKGTLGGKHVGSLALPHSDREALRGLRAAERHGRPCR